MCGNPSKVSTLFVTLADHMTSPDHAALYQRLQNLEYILSIMYKKNDRYCQVMEAQPQWQKLNTTV